MKISDMINSCSDELQDSKMTIMQLAPVRPIDNSVTTPPATVKCDLPRLHIERNWVEPMGVPRKTGMTTPIREKVLRKLSIDYAIQKPQSGLLTLTAIAEIIEEDNLSVRKPSIADLGIKDIKPASILSIHAVVPTRTPAQSENLPSGLAAEVVATDDRLPRKLARILAQPPLLSSTSSTYRGRCKYKTGKCFNERAVKVNGRPHNLCDHHRSKQNSNQRKLDRKIREKRHDVTAVVLGSVKRRKA